VLLQILEDGRLTDGHGRTVDFRNTVIIMTSNLGTEEFQRPALGFVPSNKPSRSEKERQKSAVEKALRQAFRPELLNRIDEIIVFEPLTEDDLKQIVELLLRDVRERLGGGRGGGGRVGAAGPPRSPAASWRRSSPRAIRRRWTSRTVSTRSSGRPRRRRPKPRRRRR